MRTLGISLTLAAACLAATPAMAGDAKLAWSDLDLATDAGKVELDHRIDLAANAICAPQAITGSRLTKRSPSARCLAEARETLSAQVQAKIAARNDSRRLAAGNAMGGEAR
jgi:UrcA family protein